MKSLEKWTDPVYFYHRQDELFDILPKIQSLEPVWIPVTENLPEQDVDVLVKTSERVYIATYTSERQSYEDWFGTRTDYYWWSDDFGDELEVVKWMPLPPNA